jgi:hypothetical protein
VELFEVVGGERLQGGVAAHRRRAIAVHRAVDDARKGDRHDLRRIVPGLNQRGDPFLSQAVQVGLRERRTQRHVRHDRQRVLQSRDRYVHADRRCVERAGRRQLRAEELDRVGDLK